MKAIRTYSVEEGHLIQHTSFLPEDDSLDDVRTLSVCACVDPDTEPYILDQPSLSFSVWEDSATDYLPLDLRIQEIQHFINVLKSMYYGS